MVGVHRIQGISALEKRLPPDVEEDGEEAPREEPVLVAELTIPAWWSCRRASYDRLLVRVVEDGHPDDAAEIVDRAGPYALARDWRRVAAETLGPLRLVQYGGEWSDCDGTSVALLAHTLKRFVEKWFEVWDEIPLKRAA